MSAWDPLRVCGWNGSVGTVGLSGQLAEPGGKHVSSSSWNEQDMKPYNAHEPCTDSSSHDSQQHGGITWEPQQVGEWSTGNGVRNPALGNTACRRRRDKTPVWQDTGAGMKQKQSMQLHLKGRGLELSTKDWRHRTWTKQCAFLSSFAEKEKEEQGCQGSMILT